MFGYLFSELLWRVAWRSSGNCSDKGGHSVCSNCSGGGEAAVSWWTEYILPFCCFNQCKLVNSDRTDQMETNKYFVYIITTYLTKYVIMWLCDAGWIGCWWNSFEEWEKHNSCINWNQTETDGEATLHCSSYFLSPSSIKVMILQVNNP